MQHNRNTVLTFLALTSRYNERQLSLGVAGRPILTMLGQTHVKLVLLRVTEVTDSTYERPPWKTKQGRSAADKN